MCFVVKKQQQQTQQQQNKIKHKNTCRTRELNPELLAQIADA